MTEQLPEYQSEMEHTIYIYIYIVSLCFDFSVVQCSIHKK